MKTTVELPDSLLREAKRYAATQGITLRAVFERGLNEVLPPPSRPASKKFRLKTIVTDGNGLLVEGDWATVRSMIYEGRGAKQ